MENAAVYTKNNPTSICLGFMFAYYKYKACVCILT